MVHIYRFAAVRPEQKYSDRIPSVPYDVVTVDEARACIEQNPLSFLRISRPDAELPGIPADDDRVYERAADIFDRMMADGLFVRDPEPGMYVYRAVQEGEEFLGLVCCVSTDDYENRRIRRHELTRYDKEEDRTRHIDAVNANTGLVFLLYRDTGEIYPAIASLAASAEPDGSSMTDQGVLHQVFRISDEASLARIEDLFSGVSELYIADGHHRAKSAVNVAGRRAAEGRFTDETGRFMVVLFAHNRVDIHGYSRLVTDLAGRAPAEFLKELAEEWTVAPYGAVDASAYQIPPKAAGVVQMHVVHMYLDGTWYELTRPVEHPEDLIGSLDVSVLQKDVMERILGITDPRGDSRLHYMGGAKPLSGLERLVDGGEFVLAFAMQPVKIETVLSIADRDGVMPPKSTWFEPKLVSGLVIHTLE
ncbi:DUF1015 domain-containing protein [Methanoculleus sp. FWC-SCC1]|uniref:DUF1015 domain-containing protein n=1 Tax=Methanoculleus frigidifontis TaxID=2584085 RepID=A0ABT8MDJ0_9EURY|nr:DUF1015 family protein [Methanoculleus sp. FWC-SCC1]MDN7025925.1 DUF1015 domain-containing protein [Methanoculleus sp. FWC-SCC1]